MDTTKTVPQHAIPYDVANLLYGSVEISIQKTCVVGQAGSPACLLAEFDITCVT